MKYLLLLKRLLKKKSYIAMLLVVPLMVFLLNAMSSAPSGLMTIGVFIPGTDVSSQALRQSLTDNPGSLQFVFYDDDEDLMDDIVSQQVSEGWFIPEDLDATVSDMALKGKTKNKIEVIIREEGLSHMLGREVLCARVYPSIARQIAINFISDNVYNGQPSDKDLAMIESSYDNYRINGSLFEMGYVDGKTATEEDVSYLMMPLRGILALWLFLCAIAASMYYLEDEKNGLFIWWKTRFYMIRDLLYYLVIILIPSLMVLIGLKYGGVFTTLPRELASIILYDLTVVLIAILLREIIKTIKGLGIITPILILASAIFSPVFLDFKEGRSIQRFCPTFHYLYSTHDSYYLKNLIIYSIAILILWYIIHTIKQHKK